MLSALQSGSTTASPSSSHRVWEGGASRWCRACCMLGCSNLDPVRRGSLIPDYGSLGLRHADAQVCTHLQSPNLSIWLSALNLKPHPEESINVEAVATVSVPEMRCLVKVGMLAWTIQSTPAVWLQMFLCRLMLLYKRTEWLWSVDAQNCPYAEGNGLAEMKVSLCRCYLPEHKWWGHQGGR